jgi:glycosyltransferase involved in cell wall biosynthesis
MEEICQGKQDNKEKTLAIFCWTIKNIKAGEGGTELPWFFLTSRKIIERGKGLCSESARVFITLCKKAGLKARRVSLYSKQFNFAQTTATLQGSHGIAEVFIEDKWVVFDTFWGKVFLAEENRFASIEDIQQNPRIVDRILAGVNPPLSEYYGYARYINWNRYAWLIMVHSLGYYLIGDKIDDLKLPYMLLQPELLFFSLLTFSLAILLILEGFFLKTEINTKAICMVIAHFPPTVGGSEKQAESLAHHLKNKGYQILVATMQLPGEKAYEVFNGLEIYRLPSYVRSRAFPLLFLISLIIFLVKKRKRYSVIHGHLASSPAVVSAIIGLILGKKRILKLGASREYGDVGTSKRTLRGRCKLWLLKKSVQRFIVTNQEMRDELLMMGFSTEVVELIPNGVDTDEFIPLKKPDREKIEKEMGFERKKFVVFIGRLEPQKNVATLIEAWAELKNKFPHILLIVGEGSDRDCLRDLVKSLNMEGRVMFVGKVSPREIYRYHQLADVFVLPSLSEGISNSLLEAMSCGKPVLASRIGGNYDVIKDEVDGFLFSPGNTFELSRKLERLLLDGYLRECFGQRAREKMEKMYSFHLIASRYSLLYSMLNPS